MTDVDSGSRTAGAGPVPPQAGVRLEDPELVRVWVRGATAALRRERDAIDRVNVFPVADADTGTNLYLTLREGDRAVAAAPAGSTGPQLLAIFARAALLGARGNSGVILSEWLRGLAVAARQGGDPADLLTRAAVSARSAVASPADGTILTAADAAAGGAADAAAGGAATGDTDLLAVVTAAASAARAAARASREELAELRTAGVLDAGALGLALVLDALVVATAHARSGVLPGAMSVASGSMDAVNLDQLLAPREPGDALSVAAGPSVGTVHGHRADDAEGTGALELMFVLIAPAEAATESVAARLRGELAEVGDSVVVVGGDAGTGTAVWQAHVHTDHLDRALAVATCFARTGTLAQVHVRHLAAVGQHTWGVVAATSAPALAGELAHAGAVVLLTGGMGSPVEALTADDVERAAASTGARRVLLLGPALDALPDLTVQHRTASSTGAETQLDVDELVAVRTPTDVHAVVALAALGTLLPVGLPSGVGLLDGPDEPAGIDARALVDESLSGLTVVTTRGTEAVAALRASVGPEAAVVTALLDADVPADLPDLLAGVLAELAPDAELVVLRTGCPGDGASLGTETAVDHELEGEA